MAASGSELRAYLDGTAIGTFHRTVSGNTTFTYDDDYRQQADATPLSLSMPLAAKTHPSRAASPFLQGLVPESRGRLEELAARFHTGTSAFSLLADTGRDAAGAVQLLPRNVEPPDAAERRGDVERLSPHDFDAVMADLIANAGSWGRNDSVGRWSLAGTQSKVALFRFEDGSWGTPRDATPTTHILKPAVRDLPSHDVNEYVTMEAARLLGLVVADHELEETASGHHVFITRRYDREVREGRWVRIHQEDTCQSLSVEPRYKYQQDGGPGVSAIARLFRDQMADLHDRADAQRRFFDALVFMVASLGTDAHAKNYSVILEGPRVTLAPLYDLGTFAPYRGRVETERLRAPIAIGGEYGLLSIGERQLVTAAKSLSIPEGQALERFRFITSRISAAFSQAAASADNPFAVEVAGSVERYADARGWPSDALED
ncbi:type II toxin-antitoxin system HipA family toxin [Leifsonia lichenia]